ILRSLALEKIARVEGRVAQVLEGGPVKFIGPATRLYVHRASGGAAELRRRVGGVDLELACRFNGRLQDCGIDPALVVVNPIDHEVVFCPRWPLALKLPVPRCTNAPVPSILPPCCPVVTPAVRKTSCT